MIPKWLITGYLWAYAAEASDSLAGCVLGIRVVNSDSVRRGRIWMRSVSTPRSLVSIALLTVSSALSVQQVAPPSSPPKETPPVGLRDTGHRVARGTSAPKPSRQRRRPLDSPFFPAVVASNHVFPAHPNERSGVSSKLPVNGGHRGSAMLDAPRTPPTLRACRSTSSRVRDADVSTASFRSASARPTPRPARSAAARSSRRR